jgi:hypothetical protein
VGDFSSLARELSIDVAYMKKAPAQKTAGRYEGTGRCGAGVSPVVFAIADIWKNPPAGRRRHKGSARIFSSGGRQL